MAAEHGSYYVPESSYWPLMGSIGLFITAIGAANWLHKAWYGPPIFFIGVIVIVIMIFGWFGTVISESERGLYDEQVDRSFRWSMGWFIFSEVFFFAVFFSALFYARFYSIPALGGEIQPLTHYLLWPDFVSQWPLLFNPDESVFRGPRAAMDAWGLPALNTLILLTSGVTITWAHYALKKEQRGRLIVGLLFTVILGALFMYFQAIEYAEAYESYKLTLNSGMYGTTFFMLTGFHGAHVTIGTIILAVILLRCIKGHFTPDQHFAFEAAAWYWHFVDVVWLFLFIFVYWL